MSSPNHKDNNEDILKILYICTHNRCRSALSEAITNQNGLGKLVAKSAGSHPAGEVHPLTLKYLEESGYETSGLSSNSWNDKEYLDGFEPDVLITVCDSASGESCPVWLGNLPNLTRIHWGLSDPSKNTEDEAITDFNFKQTIKQIEDRVSRLVHVADLRTNARPEALKLLIEQSTC